MPQIFADKQPNSTKPLRSKGGFTSNALREEALLQRAKLVQSAIDRGREQQARRSDKQARNRVERGKGLEGDARTPLDRDEHRGRDERAAREHDRDR